MSPEARNWLTAWRLRGSLLRISLAHALELPDGVLEEEQPVFVVREGSAELVLAYDSVGGATAGLYYRVDLDHYTTLEEAKQALWRILAPDGAKPYEATVNERSTDHA